MDGKCSSATHEIFEFFGQSPVTTITTIVGIFAVLGFILFTVYKRGINIFGKVIVPSKEDRNGALKNLEESKYYLKPDYIQKTGEDYCWFHAQKGAMMKFGGMTWNSGDHYQGYELFQTLLLSDDIDSIEFVKSAIPSKVLAGIEKKLSTFSEQNRQFTIYCATDQKNFLTTNLSQYKNLILEEI
jgi:hypothetical protein